MVTKAKAEARAHAHPITAAIVPDPAKDHC
jgi:hypothetical protein